MLEFELNLSDEKALFPAPVLTAPSSSGVGPRQKFPTRAWYQEALKPQTPGTELVLELSWLAIRILTQKKTKPKQNKTKNRKNKT